VGGTVTGDELTTGAFVGVVVGDREVGFKVGVSEGVLVGNSVGVNVGFELGTEVGLKVGFNDGEGAGFKLGAEMGLGMEQAKRILFRRVVFLPEIPLINDPDGQLKVPV